MNESACLNALTELKRRYFSREIEITAYRQQRRILLRRFELLVNGENCDTVPIASSEAIDGVERTVGAESESEHIAEEDITQPRELIN